MSDKEAKFVKAGSSTTPKLKAALASYTPSPGVSPPKFFTINDETDVGKGKNAEGVKYAYEEWLPQRFPTPSQWETRACPDK